MRYADMARASSLVSAADTYVRACFRKQTPPHVSELAALVGLSLPQLSAVFLVECGERPSTYLKRAQVARARRLLETTALSTDEVGRRAAFGTPVTFFRAFRRALGSTPAEYRRRLPK